MLFRLFITFCFILSYFSAAAQFYVFKAKNNYDTDKNPYYWKNKIPSPGYWQQDVHYEMVCRLDDEKNIIECDNFRLTYTNNAPDTLNQLFFNLYQNAFKANGYYHNLRKANKLPTKLAEYENQGLGTVCQNIKVAGQPVNANYDGSLMHIELSQPILPGQKVVITMGFKTYIDKQAAMRRRMNWYEPWPGYKHYNMVHWYPIIAAYDKKFGWNTDQHLDKEFYANFGTFDVAIDMPEYYIADGTGVLFNRNDVLPNELRNQLDLTNYASKPWNSAPSEIIPLNSKKRKNWIFHAENVHNFAFTADPLYRIGELNVEGFKVVVLAQEQHASRWQGSGPFAASILSVYANDFGGYAWPKAIIADANDGMEYPMLTLDGGYYPRHQGLLAHELGHMWFYGQVGTNEKYRAFMDEGFTQFLTSWSLEKLSGYYKTTYKDITDTRHNSVYFPYIYSASTGGDRCLNTHSNDFNGSIRHGGGYGNVYYKGATMLYNLQYVLGEDLFIKAMQNYVNQWRFCHPYPEDFKQSVMDFTGVDLNWFFDQWLTTTKKIDYSINKVTKNANASGYTIELERKGEMQMPIDLTLITNKGRRISYHIPNTWFVKKTKAEVLPKWYGWGKNLNQTYKFVANLNSEEKLTKVEIDTSLRLADIDRRNNYWNKKPALTFNDLKMNPITWVAPANEWRPWLWYNAYDGLQIGGQISGEYMLKQNEYKVNIWGNTGLGHNTLSDANDVSRQFFGFNFWHKMHLRRLDPQTHFIINGDYNAGLLRSEATLQKKFQQQDNRNPRYWLASVGVGAMYREAHNAGQYLIHPNYWSTEAVNSWVKLKLSRFYPIGKQQGITSLTLRTPGPASEFTYSYTELESNNNINLNKLLIRLRGFARLGFEQMPLESALYLAGGSPEDMYNNPFTYARGFFPDAWGGYSASGSGLHVGGGLGLRGFAGMALPNLVNSDPVWSHLGQSGLSGNIEVEFNKLIPIRFNKLKKYFDVSLYAFGDAGAISPLTLYSQASNRYLGRFYADAGLGGVLTVKFGSLQLEPILLRVDWPLYVNQTTAQTQQFDANRFVVGIGRAF